MSSRIIWSLGLLGLMIGPIKATELSSSHHEATYSFDIPAESLAKALYDFSSATGITVLVDASLTAHRLVNPVKGNKTATDALIELVDKTGLIIAYTGEKSFTLSPAPFNDASGTLSSRTADTTLQTFAIMPEIRESYFARLQRAVKQRLCQAAGVLPGRYRIAMQVWVDPVGAITDINLLASSGDQTRDAAIKHALIKFRSMETPPMNLAQPVTLVILPRLPTSTGDCISDVPQNAYNALQ